MSCFLFFLFKTVFFACFFFLFLSLLSFFFLTFFFSQSSFLSLAPSFSPISLCLSLSVSLCLCRMEATLTECVECDSLFVQHLWLTHDMVCSAPAACCFSEGSARPCLLQPLSLLHSSPPRSARAPLTASPPAPKPVSGSHFRHSAHKRYSNHHYHLQINVSPRQNDCLRLPPHSFL